MSKAWSGGSTTRWRKIRLLVLQRDGYRCQLHIPGTCTTVATQVHHMVSRAIAGDDIRYLCASCQPCNARAGEPSHTQHKRVSSW